ncbi:MAG: SDR family NAD(P)-dependent oxidoreductase [Dehalococcoidia bacterium]
MDDMRLAGKVALISGGASGMGAEEARLFAREGAKVVIADVLDDAGRLVVAEIEAPGGEALFVHTDVTREADWQRVVETAVQRYGRLDILVNNAGLSSTSEADPLDSDGWHRIMDVNATGVFLGTKHAVRAMLESGGGSIVTISSIMGFVGGEGGHPAYHASKGAVRIFTKAVAVRYGPRGIRVNSVHPGFLPPMRSSRPRNAAAMQEVIEQTPLRRTGNPLEVAYGALFLASDEASFITGTELVIDGGYIAR